MLTTKQRISKMKGETEGEREGGKKKVLPSALIEVDLFEAVPVQVGVLRNSLEVKVIQFIGVQVLHTPQNTYISRGIHVHYPHT